jgi:hypothetical protein
VDFRLKLTEHLLIVNCTNIPKLAHEYIPADERNVVRPRNGWTEAALVLLYDTVLNQAHGQVFALVGCYEASLGTYRRFGTVMFRNVGN